MKTLYIECKMGAAGDMLLGALYELCPDKDKFLTIMKELFGEHVEILPLSDNTCGIHGTHMRVRTDAGIESPESHHHSHHHSSSGSSHHRHRSHVTYSSVLNYIQKLSLSDKVRDDVITVYRMIGEAESKVHDTTLDQIHFHELGTLDALADVTGVCLLMDMLKPEQILCSSIHVGNGTVETSHGTLPVPAPATAELLHGVPYYTGEIEEELCTPTGAALLKYFVQAFCAMPEINVAKVGVGIGTKQFDTANMVRAFYGDSVSLQDEIIANIPVTVAEQKTTQVEVSAIESLSEAIANFSPDVEKEEESPSPLLSMPKSNTYASSHASSEAMDLKVESDNICDISCNIDDMTGEDLGFVMELLLNAGALDVFYQPIQMKKNRPGILLHCFCEENDTERFIQLVLYHTSTRGVRYQLFQRCKLGGAIESRDTAYGPVSYKVNKGIGIEKEKPEYEDLKRIALEQGKSILEIRKELP